jgi:ADP-L-glycero-D-manno-heptose 6-epimerase
MYVVTGGAGFIGSNIVAALSERGHEVVVVDWLRHDARWRNLAKHEIRDLIAPDALRECLPRHERAIDTVIHMGAHSPTTESDVDPVFHRTPRDIRPLDWCTPAARPTHAPRRRPMAMAAAVLTTTVAVSWRSWGR